jgi:hypothetical protein
MEFLNKIEQKVVSWFKTTPNLPNEAKKWLADNVWWFVIIGVILSIINILRGLSVLESQLSMQGTVANSYYVSASVSDWVIVTVSVSLVFLILEAILLFFAIQPLKEKQKKGWVLLFAAWLISAVALVVNALLTLGVLSFIISILFGGIWLAISGYFLFEIHGQFAHVERSKGVKNKK